MNTPEFHQFIRPEAVAVIGASRTPGSIGNTAVKNFRVLNYQGKVFPINPRYDEVEGFPCYPALAEVPAAIDVVIIAVASELVESAVQQSVEKKVKFIVIFSSGFAEASQEGEKKQEAIMTLCRQNGIRVLGPNTMGAYNLKDRILLTFVSAEATNLLAGQAGLVSQSGATGGTVLNMAAEEQVGFTYVLTTGNQMDLSTEDFLELLVDDEDTKLVAAYLEGIVKGEKLKETCARALSRHKPVIALKAGRSEAGKKAALSHTASLTGSNLVFEMFARQYGVTLVNELEEMIDAMKAFKSAKRPQGNRVATLVISGAIGIMLADKLPEFGLEMAVLQATTKKRLAEVVPGYCSLTNPVDIGATLMGNPALYKHCIATLASAEEVDILIVHLPVGSSLGGLKFAGDILEVAGKSEKPIIVLNTGPEEAMGEIRKLLNKNDVPAYRSLKSAVQAAHYLLNYEKAYCQRQKLVFTEIKDKLPVSQLFPPNASSVTEPHVKHLLRQFAIPVPRGVVGKDWKELKQLVKGLSFPVAAKVVSPDITHKSDVGGVFLPIENEDGLEQACETIIKNIRQNAPGASMDGILVEELVQGPFLEVIIGVQRDPVFGPFILCGLGGIYVEVMQDITRRLAPVSEFEALEMIRQLKSYSLFTGIRKGIAYDLRAFATTLSQLSYLALSLEGAWTELEINPLVVRPEGQGVMALDGLLTFQQ